MATPEGDAPTVVDCEGEPLDVSTGEGLCGAESEALPVAELPRRRLLETEGLPDGEGVPAAELVRSGLRDTEALPSGVPLEHAVAASLNVTRPLPVRQSDFVCECVRVPAPSRDAEGEDVGVAQGRGDRDTLGDFEATGDFVGSGEALAPPEALPA